MRITYRTVRVLAAVGRAPGASNRLAAELAGISEQGQISKLLRRLERVGLVRSDGNGPAKGTANAWMLTEKGAQLERAISASVNHRRADRQRARALPGPGRSRPEAR